MLVGLKAARIWRSFQKKNQRSYVLCTKRTDPVNQKIERKIHAKILKSHVKDKYQYHQWIYESDMVATGLKTWNIWKQRI